MTKNRSIVQPSSTAALQRLIWSKGRAATWRTTHVFKSLEAAKAAMTGAPDSDDLRVLVEVSAAMRIGAVTRDARPEVTKC